MIETKTWTEKINARRPQLRNILLALQIVLPFALYVALEAGQTPLAVVIAGLIAFSMAVLVWLG